MNRPFEAVILPWCVEIDAAKESHFIFCRKCNDFRELPFSMDESPWIKAVQDFAFEHDHPEQSTNVP